MGGADAEEGAAARQPAGLGDLGRDPRARGTQSQPAPSRLGFPASAPPVVWATDRCPATRVAHTQQERSQAVALGNAVHWFPRPASPASGSGPGEGSGRGRRHLGCLGGGGVLWDGTRTSKRRPPWRRGEAETTAPSRPRKPCSWRTQWLLGWEWGPRELGCLCSKDRGTPPPCSRSPPPPGLWRPMRLPTPATSARTQVSRPS